jgi:hypothetical protein
VDYAPPTLGLEKDLHLSWGMLFLKDSIPYLRCDHNPNATTREEQKWR